MSHKHKYEKMVIAADKFGFTLFKMCHYSLSPSQKREKGSNYASWTFQKIVLTAGYNYWTKWHHAGRLTYKQQFKWRI